jgi:serine protease Do
MNHFNKSGTAPRLSAARARTDADLISGSPIKTWHPVRWRRLRVVLFLWMALGLLLFVFPGKCAVLPDQLPPSARLADGFFKNGIVTLRSFAPVVWATRHSVAQIQTDGTAVALATIIDSNGLALTKASEIKSGSLTALLAGGKRAPARTLAIDEANDVALVKIDATRLEPIRWAGTEAVVGQWAVTPGTDVMPEAVGIVSAPLRKILPKRAYIGVELDFEAPDARIARIMPGLGAEKAGLQPGDVIVAVNSRPVEKRADLPAALRNFREKQTVQLHIRRKTGEFDAAIEMAYRDEPRIPRQFQRQERMNQMGGDLSQRAEGFDLAIQHDTVLQPWQCGGPLVDVEGRAIGINIARAGRVASYALPVDLVKEIVVQLRRRAAAGKP